jgi:hypothetical protein
MTKTLPETFSVQDDFPAVDYDQWRSVVDQALGGAPFDRKLVSRTYDGVDVQPVYSSRDESQLEDIADLTLGDIFDGTSDLWTAFAKAKGNN